MADELIQLATPASPSIIKVIGVGGGGGNAVGQMYRDNIPEVRYLVCNTDEKALHDSPVPDHLQMGPGLGAGGVPELGCKYAEESLEQINAALDAHTKMVFITAGMGGGTGTGASPIIAREARKKDILTVGIVTLPFLFEREKQIRKALAGLDRLAEEVDALLVINNQRLIDIYADISILNAFRRADETLSTAVSSITEIISMHGRINLDFNDVRKVLKDGGVAVISTGYGEGPQRVTDAINEALNSPLLNNNDVYNADRLIMAITFNPDENVLLTEELNELEDFMANFNDDIDTKWGMACDKSMGQRVKITLLASGFGLYSRHKTDNATSPETPQDMQMDTRRDRFYTRSVGRNRHHIRPRVYLFSPDDLTNEEVAAAVAATPTHTRTHEQLAHIREQSAKAAPAPRAATPDQPAADADAQPITIEF